MNNTNIAENINKINLVLEICDESPEAMEIVMHMINSFNGRMNIYLCEALGIRGIKLYKLYNDCCNQDYDKFNRTLTLFRYRIYNQKEIQTNLELAEAIPFIDDNIILENSKEFGPKNKGWQEYCYKNKRLFIERLNAKLNKQNKKRNLKK